MGLPDYQNGVPEKGEYPIHADTAYAIELSVTVSIQDWGGQEVQLSLEQEGFFSPGRSRFIGGRQTAFHLVR